ncbi:putative F-box domain, FIST domain, F-box-like domain superfamily protein [Helianthus annuus]|nr:putative F-box domain, FIST domain, F-box-like domain superfamily protein [Helianthus annuus]
MASPPSGIAEAIDIISEDLRQCRIAAPIDVISEDLLQNIVSRLPAVSFASAACVSRSWNVVCDRVLSRPKLASACSFNHTLQDAVEEVVNKVLSEPIRPHFAIASFGGYHEESCLGEAHQLITAALGAHVPVISNHPDGIIGKGAISDKVYEVEWYFRPDEVDSVMLIVGFLPGLKVTIIPLLKQIQEPETVMIDEFVTDIREFSTSVSGCDSPAAIIMFADHYYADMRDVIEQLDYAMSPETVIVGDALSKFRFTNDAQFGSSAAVSLVFAVEMNKPPGIGETQFHAVLSSGLSPVGPTYTTSVIEKTGVFTDIAARREGSVDNIDGETLLNQVKDELGGEDKFWDLFIGVTKKRKYSIRQEKVGSMTSLAFHLVLGRSPRGFYVHGGGLKTDDTFRFYYSNPTTALSSTAAVSSHLRSFNQGRNDTTVVDKVEVFGGLIFACPDTFDKPNIKSSPFLDNFPGVTLGGSFCSSMIGRRVLTKYVKESQEQKEVQCCVHVNGSVYLIMSYTPSLN